jgi:CDP-2,3-bis-(O-geranylgeranyl)-sn-glycerol synthase
MNIMLDTLNFWILTPLWFAAPIYIANVSPLFFKWLPLFKTPVDFGFCWNGKRIFGDHKTWRGIFIGCLIGTVTALIQFRPPIQGFLLGLGNFLGDLIGAAVKRRLNIPPGGKSLLLDCLPSPFIAICIATIVHFNTLTIIQSGFLILATIPLHIFFNRLWHTLGLKKYPW